MNAETKLNRSRILMMRNLPFFGLLSLYLEPEFSNSCPTVGTDGRKLLMNPQFVDKMTERQFNWILLHEVMHIVLKHLWRRGARDPMTWNIACDYCIHSMMRDEMNYSSYPTEQPPGILYDPKYRDMTADQIYDDIVKNQGAGGGAGNGGGSLLDDHSQWGSNGGNNEGEGEEGGAHSETEWDNRIQTAATASEMKGCGNLPAGIERILRRLRKPLKDWRSLLNQYMVATPDDYGWSPPDYRTQDMDVFLPDLTDERPNKLDNVVIWIDASGSMNDEEIMKVFSEAVGILDQFGGKVNGWLGFFDHDAYELNRFEEVSDLRSIRPRGGGGTNFTAPFVSMYEQLDGQNITCVVFMTDGEASWPSMEQTRGVPIVWLFTYDNDHNRPPFGQYTYIRD